MKRNLPLKKKVCGQQGPVEVSQQIPSLLILEAKWRPFTSAHDSGQSLENVPWLSAYSLHVHQSATSPDEIRRGLQRHRRAHASVIQWFDIESNGVLKRWRCCCEQSESMDVSGVLFFYNMIFNPCIDHLDTWTHGTSSTTVIFLLLFSQGKTETFVVQMTNVADMTAFNRLVYHKK